MLSIGQQQHKQVNEMIHTNRFIKTIVPRDKSQRYQRIHALTEIRITCGHSDIRLLNFQLLKARFTSKLTKNSKLGDSE